MGNEGSTYGALPTALRPPRWQATLPATAPSPPLLRSPPHWAPAEFPTFLTPPIVAPLPAPMPPTASCTLTTLEAATVTPWRLVQFPPKPVPLLPHPMDFLPVCGQQPLQLLCPTCRKASTIDHDPPANGSTKVPEVGEYTALPPARGMPFIYPCRALQGPPPSTHPAGAQSSSGAAPRQPPPLPQNPSLRPCPSDPPPTALQPTHDPTPVLPQCKRQANSE
ncbi:hypothetical protein E4T56_gene6928 [Termitomyces sp. T112]|nr:hypothetical protein E4T56_gene6928 [Termitomyces sp. T112]